MPGYILHLTAAKMALDKLQKIDMGFKDSRIQNDFFAGSLLPDTVNDNAQKDQSHFRNPMFHGNMVEYPDLQLFLKKYRSLLKDVSCLGYYFHLYVDRMFFKEYLPQIVIFLNQNHQETLLRKDVQWAYLNRTGQMIPIGDFFSGIWYYGDYTKMNTYLVEQYQLPVKLDIPAVNPGIEEVDYRDLEKVLMELQGYLEVSADKVRELKVFQVEHLLSYLEKVAEKFVVELGLLWNTGSETS